MGMKSHLFLYHSHTHTAQTHTDIHIYTHIHKHLDSCSRCGLNCLLVQEAAYTIMQEVEWVKNITHSKNLSKHSTIAWYRVTSSSCWKTRSRCDFRRHMAVLSTHFSPSRDRNHHRSPHTSWPCRQLPYPAHGLMTGPHPSSLLLSSLSALLKRASNGLGLLILQLNSSARVMLWSMALPRSWDCSSPQTAFHSPFSWRKGASGPEHCNSDV